MFADNLQSETNLHNFAGPAFYDWLYRLAGLALMAVGIGLRFGPGAPGLLGRAADWLRNTATGLPLLLSAGVLMQHPTFQELSEAALTGATVHGLWVLRRAFAEPTRDTM